MRQNVCVDFFLSYFSTGDHAECERSERSLGGQASTMQKKELDFSVSIPLGSV
jgi:hypothetical protein